MKNTKTTNSKKKFTRKPKTSTPEQIERTNQIEQMTEDEKWNLANEKFNELTKRTNERTAEQMNKPNTEPKSQDKPNSGKPESKKIYFCYVNPAMIKTDNETTRDILEARIKKEKINFDGTMIETFLNAVHEETERLKLSNLNTFIESCRKYAHSVNKFYTENNKISFKQFVGLFNIIYALSKCRTNGNNKAA